MAYKDTGIINATISAVSFILGTKVLLSHILHKAREIRAFSCLVAKRMPYFSCLVSNVAQMALGTTEKSGHSLAVSMLQKDQQAALQGKSSRLFEELWKDKIFQHSMDMECNDYGHGYGSCPVVPDFEDKLIWIHPPTAHVKEHLQAHLMSKPNKAACLWSLRTMIYIETSSLMT